MSAKSCGVVFTNKIKTKIDKPLKVNGKLLKMDKKVKFLGMIFDQKLTWDEHVSYIEDRCKGRLNLMRSLTGTKFGASKRCLLTIYRALIRSVLDYGAIAYDTAARRIKARLDVLQGKALRICCGAMVGTATCALQNECREQPLSLRRRKLQIQYSVKIKAIAITRQTA